jgi:hypothetical protein
MATGLRTRRPGLLRRLFSRRRCETYYLGGPDWPDDPDDGSAGVREPRRPMPDLPTLAAEAQE